VYTELTKTIKVQSIVIYRRHNKLKGLKHHLGLYSKPVTILKVFLNYNQCSINANRKQWLHTQS